MKNHVNDTMGDVYRNVKRQISDQTPHCLRDSHIDNILGQDALLERINSIIPEHASKLLPDLVGLSSVKENRIADALLELDWQSMAMKAGYLANRYGNCYILLDVDDGRAIDKPVDVTKRPGINSIYYFTGDNCRPVVDINLQSYNEPEFYEINFNGDLDIYHASRVLVFYGKKLYNHAHSHNNYRDEPVWLSAYNSLEHYDKALQAALDMLKDSSVFIYKLDGFHEMLEQAKALDCEGDSRITQQIVNRLNSLITGRSINNAMMLDSEKEEVSYVERSFNSVDLIVKTLRLAFAERTGLPVSVLFGSSESGLFSDSGASDRYALSAMVNTYQRKQHTPNLKKLIRIYDYKALTHSIQYPPTVELTQKEIADTSFAMSKSLATYVTTGILNTSQAAAYLGDRQMRTHIQLTPQEVEEAINNQVTNTGGINNNTGGVNSAGVSQSN